MLCESGFLTKYSSVRYSERKKQVKCRAWGQESVRISVIAGVCFSHFFMRFAGGLALVRISKVSVLARCPQGVSRLYLEKLDAHWLLDFVRFFRPYESNKSPFSKIPPFVTAHTFCASQDGARN